MVLADSETSNAQEGRRAGGHAAGVLFGFRAPGPLRLASSAGFETATRTDIPNNNKTARGVVTRPGEWPVTEKGASRSRADPFFDRLARHPTKRELGTGQTRNRRAFTF